MTRCKFCKHWAPNHERENCRSEPNELGYADCLLIDDGYGDLAVLDLSEMGMLKTKAEFGCVLGEAKEER